MRSLLILSANQRLWLALSFALLTPLPCQARPSLLPSLLRDLAQIPSVSGTAGVFQALCPDHSRCREVWEKDAGQDAVGRAVKVVRLAGIDVAPTEKDPLCDTCHLKGETWSVAIGANGAMEKQQMETDPYADRQEMDPESPGNLPGFAVGPNSLTITTLSSRGSWGGATAWQLFPKKVLWQTWAHQIPAGGADSHPPFFQAAWDGRTRAGGGTMELQRPCPRAQAQAGRFHFIPLILRGDDYIRTGWKTAGLGEGALEVTGDNGFLLAGKRPTGLVMRVALASARDLFVEIPGTRFVTNAAKWLASDHLELWQVEGEPGWEPQFPAVQWGIQLGDGKVIAAHGDPKGLPSVEKAVVQAPGKPAVTLLHIRLYDPVDDFGFLTVSYSASDHGRKVGSLLGTSQVCFGQGETLGLVKKVDAEGAGSGSH